MPDLRRDQPALDTTDHTVETQHCAECDTHFMRVTGYVHAPDGGPTLASYYAVCHGHPEHEIALDLTLGTWGDDAPDDYETFSCLIRPAPQGVRAVNPFVTLSFGEEEEIPAPLGRPMSREDALASPRITTVWAIVDALIEAVDPIAEQINAEGGNARDR